MQQLERAKAHNTDTVRYVRRITPYGAGVLPKVNTSAQLRQRRVRADEVNKLADRVEHDRDEQGVIGVDQCELVEPEHIGPSKANSLRNAERL